MTTEQATDKTLNKDQLAAVLELYKPDAAIKTALEAHFLQGKSLREAGKLCGKTKQGMAYHVTRIRALHATLLLSLKHLKGNNHA